MTKINQKHKTVGVSFNPLIRKKANLRSRQLGVTFSRYIGLCVEAEIAGKTSAISSPQAEHLMMPEGINPLEQAMNERLQTDVAVLLRRLGVSFAQQVSLGGVYTDFFISEPEADAAATEAGRGVAPGKTRLKAEPSSKKAYAAGTQTKSLGDEACSANARTGIAIECRYPSVVSGTSLLGRAILLQQADNVGAVLLCVPYRSVFEPELLAVFAQQKIAIVTPDTLPAALATYTDW